MERDLNQRFQRVASKFGVVLKNGMNNAAQGFGYVLTTILASHSFTSAITDILRRVVDVAFNNPFDQLTQSINELLNKMRTTAQRAAQLGTTTERYAEIEQIAKSAGVQNIDQLVSIFQAQLELSRQGKQPLLQEFTQNKDTLTAFIQAIQSLKDAPEDERAAFIRRIFGQGANIQLAGLLNTNLSERRQQIFGGISSETFGAAVDKLAKNSELQQILQRQTEVRDILAKSKLINYDIIRSQEVVFRERKGVENIQFGNYGEFAKWAITQAEWQQTTAKFQTDAIDYMSKFYEFLNSIVEFINEIRTKGWRAIF